MPRLHDMRRRRALCAVVALTLLSLAPSAFAREISDMGGRKIVIPDNVVRVVTLGAVPVINGFLFALGEQKAIVNGVPSQLARKWQFIFAPELVGKPVVQGAEAGPSAESIVALKPDIVLTMDLPAAEALAKVGVKAVYLRWTAPSDVKAVVTLLGDVFHKERVAADYAAWFDRELADVAKRIDAAKANRPRVLYANLKRLTQPHRIADGWISRAGGVSMTDDGRMQESFVFSLEQLLSWDPEVLIVADQGEKQQALTDPRLRNVSAIKTGRVHVAPAGAHLWANRTIEQPLTVLWAAGIIHPELFDQQRLVADAGAFYARFFHVTLSRDQIEDILAGTPAR